ncbi:MAG TPA: hypothetical protein VGJ05_09065 [Fimbriiglobus sp.]|jgi:hypothetical protein
MDASVLALAPLVPPSLPPDPVAIGKRTDLILDALKPAIVAPGEHRLFRSGKLGGLFASKHGPSAEAAKTALADGLLEITRTETRGKFLIEWVRVTSRGIAYVGEHDTPKATLRELKSLLGATRAGVPAWMAEARAELQAVGSSFEAKANALILRLDDLARRVETALRRADVARHTVSEPIRQLVPWAADALEYLDQRDGAGAAWVCPLSELFHSVAFKHPDLTLAEFHSGLRRLCDVRALTLSPAHGTLPEPEYALVVDGKMMGFAAR